MTAHDHRTIIPGCYRCELGRDEAMATPDENFECYLCDATMRPDWMFCPSCGWVPPHWQEGGESASASGRSTDG